VPNLFASLRCDNKRIWIAGVSFFVLFGVGEIDHPALAENETVTIPFGAANPNFDTPTTDWFSPSVLTIQAGDTVTWVNKDKEIHNITSGKGITRIQFATTSDIGTPDGLFSSGSFKPGQAWSYTFTKPGIYHYFCSIHPWMNGAIVVNQQVPKVATDATGQPIIKWPIEIKTLDDLYEADLSWEPHIILTNEKVTLVFNFYNGITGRLIESGVPYTLVIAQNGKEIFRTDGATQVGGDYKFYSFSDPGLTTFRFINIGGGNSFMEFSTLVYQNPNATSTHIPIIEPARNIVFGQELIIVLIGPPIVIIAAMILSAKGVFSRKKDKTSQDQGKRSPM